MPSGRRALLAGGLAALAAAPAQAERAVPDATGRRVAVPDRIARVFPAGPPAAILLYTVAPELLAGGTGRRRRRRPRGSASRTSPTGR